VSPGSGKHGPRDEVLFSGVISQGYVVWCVAFLHDEVRACGG
jgi:hypothetical protein